MQKPEPTQEKVAPITAKKRPRKKSFSSPASFLEEERRPGERPKTTSHSDSPHEADPPQLTVKKKRKPRESAEPNTSHEEKLSQNAGQKPPLPAEAVQSEQKQNGIDASDEAQSTEAMFDATKISLPFADTPIIRRNKEMRKGAEIGSRRSSLGLRGRRASSLIDAGKSNGLSCSVNGRKCR